MNRVNKAERKTQNAEAEQNGIKKKAKDNKSEEQKTTEKKNP